MNCKEIQDIILTDYIDNELGSEELKAVELHLKQCPDCSSFKEDLFSSAVLPLRNVKPAILHPAAWIKIREALEQDKRDSMNFGLRELASFFKPRWANIATLVSILLFTLFAGSFLAQNILSLESSRQIVSEAASSLGATAFNDITSEQVEDVYNQIITI
jgi:hypothetical protein